MFEKKEEPRHKTNTDFLGGIFLVQTGDKRYIVRVTVVLDHNLANLDFF